MSRDISKTIGALFMINPDALPTTSGIYCLSNRVNGKCYIGLSKNIRNRVNGHLKNAAIGKRRYALYSAIRKHGAELFDVRILELCDASLLCEREQYWIALHGTISPSGYNLSRGGEASPMEHQEVRAKSGAALRKHYENPAMREKHGNAIRKAYENPGYREKVSIAARKRFENPAYRARALAATSKYFDNPVVRAEFSAAQRRRYEDPVYRARVSAAIRKAHRSPEVQAKLRAAQRRRFENPAVGAKLRAAHSEYFAKPINREKASAKLRERFSDPEVRAKLSAVQRKRLEDPVSRSVLLAGHAKASYSSRCEVDGRIFNSLAQACRSLGIDLRDISRTRKRMKRDGVAEYRGRTFRLAPIPKFPGQSRTA